MSALLTISIPTFNRAETLDALLASLFAQIDAFRDEIRIVVVDNHSTDETALRCAEWKQKGMGFEYICNVENIGMAANIIKCFEIAETEFSWTIGDDDVLRDGMLAQILKVLRQNRPDLLHFGAQSFHSPTSVSQMRAVKKISPMMMDAMSFVRLVHVYMTFLSCLVLRKATYQNIREPAPTYKYRDTVLPQLSWILGILTTGNSFCYIPQRLVFSRAGGSGGYNACETFSTQITEILDSSTTIRLARVFKARTVVKYLPSMIIAIRTKASGDFSVSDGDPAHMKRAYSKFVAYWLFVVPVTHLPLWLARIVYLVSRLTSKCISVLDRVDIYAFKLQR